MYCVGSSKGGQLNSAQLAVSAHAQTYLSYSVSLRLSTPHVHYLNLISIALLLTRSIFMLLLRGDWFVDAYDSVSSSPATIVNGFKAAAIVDTLN